MGFAETFFDVRKSFHRPALLASAVAVGVMLSAPQPAAQEYEYEPDEGLHQEEWYDPSDWFDTTPGVDYEQDWWDTLGNTWGYDAYDYNDYDYGWGYDYDYGGDDYELYEDPRNNTWSTATTQTGTADQNYGWHYDWNPVSGTWRSDYGYYTTKYNFDARNDFGWHYDWNPNSQEWVTDYGWHSSNWDYDRNRFNYDSLDEQQERRAQTTAQRQQQRGEQRARQTAAQTRNLHTVRGEVESFRQVNLGGQQGQRTIANVRLNSGKQVMVALGARDPKALGLEQGDQVVMQGREIQMQGGDALLAQRVRIGDQEFNLAQQGRQAQRQQGQFAQQRSQQERQFAQRDRTQRQGKQTGAMGRGPQQEQGQGQMVEIRGQLQELQRANLDGIRENHTLARVTLQNGREAVVDLGANFAQRYGRDRVQQLMQRSDQGDQIVIRGERQRINGREIVKARQFRLEGRNILNQRNQNQRNQNQAGQNRQSGSNQRTNQQ